MYIAIDYRVLVGVFYTYLAVGICVWTSYTTTFLQAFDTETTRQCVNKQYNYKNWICLKFNTRLNTAKL